MSENDERVREAWNVLRRFGQVPLPITPDGAVINPRCFREVCTEEAPGWVDVKLVSTGGEVSEVTFFNDSGNPDKARQLAQEFVNAILMHWSLVR